MNAHTIRTLHADDQRTVDLALARADSDARFEIECLCISGDGDPCWYEPAPKTAAYVASAIEYLTARELIVREGDLIRFIEPEKTV